MAQAQNEGKRLLVVEDDPGLQKQLRWCFEGFDVLIAGDRGSALELLDRHHPPVVTLDLGLPPDAGGTTEGLATLREIHEARPDAKVIVVTGNDDRENAVRAVGMGAFDFYQKPIDAEILGLIVNRAYRVHELEMENRRLSEQTAGTSLDGVIACSAVMLNICRTVEKVAPADATTLLLGESGTGKELIARALHELSPRGKGPCVAINCAAIPETLLESELFGYEKGAFTGAAKQTLGKIESAHGGTLFLDEVGDLPMSLQAKLLRFLQERVVEHLGGRKEIPVDVRVICATHCNLQALITTRDFREDLYYRISEISIHIPPLRGREGDVLLLARHFLDQIARHENRTLSGFSQDALTAMEDYAWPGNVRELKNRIKRAVIMAEGTHISAQDLELSAPVDEPPSFRLREAREHAERQAVLRALGRVGGKVSEASELLGVSRPTLYDMIRKFRLKV